MHLRRRFESTSRYAAGIAGAGDIAVLAHSLQQREQQRLRLCDEMATLDALEHLSTFDASKIERQLRARLNEWRGTLKWQTPLSRQVIARILEGDKITWTPRADDGVYEYSGRASLDKLLSGVVDLREVWRPQRDSRKVATFHIPAWRHSRQGMTGFD